VRLLRRKEAFWFWNASLLLLLAFLYAYLRRYIPILDRHARNNTHAPNFDNGSSSRASIAAIYTRRCLLTHQAMPSLVIFLDELQPTFSKTSVLGMDMGSFISEEIHSRCLRV
jgi:hypothetical protein